MSSSQPMSTDAERIIDVDVMTVSCCNPAYMSLLDWVHVHWSFHLLCNCRVGMTYVWIVPSFITHFQLLATTKHGIMDTVYGVRRWTGRLEMSDFAKHQLSTRILVFWLSMLRRNSLCSYFGF